MIHTLFASRFSPRTRGLSLAGNALALALISLFATLTANAQWPQTGSDIPVDERVEWHVLDNGLRVVLMPWAEPPERVSLRLLVEAGSLHERDDQKGLAHFIEHMAFNGTRNYTPGEMIEYFQRLGMAFGPDTNAHTWWRETVYKLELPRNEAALITDGLKLLRDYADGILFGEEEIDKERGVVLSEMRDRNTPAFESYLDQLQFSIPGSLIADRVTIGDADILRTAPRQVFLDFYNTWYRCDRMVIIAVGEFDSATLLEQVKVHFGDMVAPEAPVPDLAMGAIEPRATDSRLFSHEKLPNATVSLYHRTPLQRQTQQWATREATALRFLANSMLGQRLDDLARKEGSVIFGGAAYAYDMLDFVRYQGVAVDSDSSFWQQALDTAVVELNRALQHGFSAREFERAKAQMLSALERAAETEATRKSRELSSALVRSIVDNEVFVDPRLELQAARQWLESLTAEAVHADFRRNWETDERLLFVEGNFGSLVTTAFEASAAKPVEPMPSDALTPFAYTSFGTPGEVTLQEEINEPENDLKFTRVRFGNNVNLSLKQTDFEQDSILVQVRFGHGSLDEPADKPGLATFAGYTFNLGGLGQHSYEELRDLLAPFVVNARFAVGMDSFTLTGTTRPQDLALQLQLLAAYLTDPGYHPDAERMLQRQMDALYTQLETTPEGILQRKVAPFLAGGDARFGVPDKALLAARNLDEVRAWLNPILANAFLEIAVVGDFPDAAQVIDLVAKTFGALPARAAAFTPHPLQSSLRVPDSLPPTSVFTFADRKPQAFAIQVWPTTGQRDILEVRRLSILAEVLTDRMRIDIRENASAAYSAYANPVTRDGLLEFGYLQMFASVHPDNVDSVASMQRAIVDAVLKDGITDDELLRAVEPVKKQIEEFRRTNNYWANSVLSRSVRAPERIEWARSFSDFWESITTEQLMVLANRYLGSPPAQVTVLPESN